MMLILIINLVLASLDQCTIFLNETEVESVGDLVSKSLTSNAPATLASSISGVLLNAGKYYSIKVIMKMETEPKELITPKQLSQRRLNKLLEKSILYDMRSAVAFYATGHLSETQFTDLDRKDVIQVVLEVDSNTGEIRVVPGGNQKNVLLLTVTLSISIRREIGCLEHSNHSLSYSPTTMESVKSRIVRCILDYFDP
ncbi:hypothetical protein ECANGB1_1931 [Enterospora canceri]|uniref:Uncharacterized protein n=1 Tax=Enterospora canceri TaxID=1081671 RepID=A0A1Y1S5D2_9MICR|nr:hypothetical protein ECANGB1_1931 [Enterospora canceri]